MIESIEIYAQLCYCFLCEQNNKSHSLIRIILIFSSNQFNQDGQIRT